MTRVLSNWAGNLTYRAARIHDPATVDEVQRTVARCVRARALGSRHSFNAIADCPEDLISLDRLDRILEIDTDRRTVTIEGGVRYGQLCGRLHSAGFALHNLASLPHISVAGACATATHGSGDRNGCLATAVSAMDIITAEGDLVTYSRERDSDFPGAVVSLGGLGIVVRLTLDVSPTFAVRQNVYERLPLDQAVAHLDEIMARGYSVSLFTDWQSRTISQIWVKERADSGRSAPPDLFGAPPARAGRHPIAELSAESCTGQMGAEGAWHDRLPHFRMEFTPSCGEELQTEYLVPRPNAGAAILAMDRLRSRIAPLLLISELRTVAADDLWMSPFFEQACLGLHFTWTPDWPAVRALLPEIEAALGPLGARPHWGKLFTMAPAAVASRYPKLAQFRDLLLRLDPRGKFRNDFLNAYVMGETA